MRLADFFPHRDLKKGIFYVLLTWLCFSTIYMISKLIGPRSTVATMVFVPNLLSTIFILPWVVKDWPKNLKITNPRLMFLRALMGVLNVALVFLAIQRISLVNATLLNNTAPFFVPFILWFWMRTPINHKLWPAIIAGFIGLALILQPDKHILNLGAIYGIASGVCLAMTLVTMRLMAKTERPIAFIFYLFLIAAVLSAPFGIWDWKIASFETFLFLICISLLSLLGQWFLFLGLKHGKAHELAPFAYAMVIFSGIYEWLIWGIHLGWIFYVGMVLIIGSGVWIVYLSRPPKD